MNAARVVAVLIALAMWGAVSSFAQDVPLTTDGKVPGQPFQALQQQINSLQTQLDSLHAKANALDSADGELQLQIDQMQAQIGQLAAQLADIQLTPGPQGPPGPQGLPGAPVAGQTCPPGQSVVGFDVAGYLLCATLVGGAQPQIPLYDDFDAMIIDPNRWTEVSFPGCSLTFSPDGILHIDATYTGSGGYCGLRFANPDLIMTFLTDIRLDAVSVDGGDVRARVFGMYFASDSGAEDGEGDVFAAISLRDFDVDTGIGTLQWAVAHCTSPGCATYGAIAAGTLDAIQLGSWRTIGMRWDGANSIAFYADGAETVIFDTSRYGIYSAGGPIRPRKEVTIRGTDAGGVPPSGTISLSIDNVQCADLTGGAPCY